MLEDAGLIEQREGRLELTPRGIRAMGAKALGRPVPQSFMKDRPGRHATRTTRVSVTTRPYAAQAVRMG